ncbi:hypothetical protein BGW36DRAFT_359151 [Talaromyces proteolyticus]|uniref:PKS/mFAS DH domain-containing protein n=1 Tax=Talaromyces proteolyticus TaxID=1131652 RepID=A0AAD4KQY4_9EURO|nr:uncharacterized protein BGW36DRAFT_359151 [Talaromyces proteolyticus]KAH8697355.1 hypothetical protein BGW36DRAFT_359151 [Talaromyces proteolyticus]
MAIMAVEGGPDLADSKRVVARLLLKDATFMYPISISTISKTEVHLCMRQLRSVLEKGMTSYEFRIYIGTGDQQQDNCRGVISVQYQNSSPNWSAAEKLSLKENHYYQNRWSEAVRGCSEHVLTDKMYQAFEDDGVNYGSSLQLLDI